METQKSQKTFLTFGFYTSIFMSLLTLVTFGFAITAIPSAGPYCPGNCMDYPFPDILLYYPRDYRWMYLAIFQLFAFVVFMVSNHYIANATKKLFTFLSIAFALISATVLLLAYFTQFSVVPISVMKGETDGIALITQYNEHGLFIAMEELGYISMSLALFFLAFAFTKLYRLERGIRIILIGQLFLNVFAFLFYALKFGIERSYLFEVATITINWLTLIITGLLIGMYYRQKIRY
ncbi:MAG: hypothetical protein CVU09_00870 [Bacteroidetes bacterium HGW-Bacteroidetes-4]|jgi:hypothetical protein|nr:MAG: hypothetical protein CVU09_00870 [Bacteroidetes bacterium HGW-Bacteroidetes-4]